jgi:hypothetical protein
MRKTLRHLGFTVGAVVKFFFGNVCYRTHAPRDAIEAVVEARPAVGASYTQDTSSRDLGLMSCPEAPLMQYHGFRYHSLKYEVRLI